MEGPVGVAAVGIAAIGIAAVGSIGVEVVEVGTMGSVRDEAIATHVIIASG